MDRMLPVIGADEEGGRGAFNSLAVCMMTLRQTKTGVTA
jgi:ribonuclease HIII